MTTPKYLRPAIGRFGSLPAAAPALLLLLSGCGPTPQSAPAAATRFMDATYGDPKTFNYLLANETSSTDHLQLVFRPLINRNPETQEIEPELAEKWESTPDGKVWNFHLRPGLKWSDGVPLTADDVVFTFQVIGDKSIPTTFRDQLTFAGHVLQCKKIDDTTVEISAPVRLGPVLDALTQTPIQPYHKLEAQYKAGKFNSTWALNTPPSDIPGNGPFLISEYTTGQKLVFKKNPYYWRKAADGSPSPKFEGGVTQIVPNRDTMALKFKAGETDYTWLRPEDWAPILAGQSAGKYTTREAGPTWGFTYLTFNVNPANKKIPDYKRAWFNRKEFRWAVSYALDRGGMVKTVLRGMGVPLRSPVSPADKVFFDSALPPIPNDMSKAQAMLAVMGLSKKNADGFLVDDAGHVVEFTLYTNSNNNIRIGLCTAIQEDLRKIGIKVTLTPTDFNSLVARLRTTFDWEAVVLGFTGGAEPYVGRNIWSSTGISHVWYPQQAKPATPWEKEVDEIFDKAATEPDTEKRKALYNRWQEIMYEQQPFVFLVTEDALTAVSNRITGPRPQPLAGSTLPMIRWNSYEFSPK